MEAVLRAVGGIAEVVGGQGWDSKETVAALMEPGFRSWVWARDWGRRGWCGKLGARATVRGNRRRIRRLGGMRVLHQRGECVGRDGPLLWWRERPYAVI